MAKRARRRRKRITNSDAIEAVAGSGPYVNRQLPFFDPLDEETLVKLEEQSDWLIQEIGLEFRDDPTALNIWKAAGADVSGTRVRAPADLIRSICKKAPSEFTQLACDPKHSVKIGGRN